MGDLFFFFFVIFFLHLTKFQGVDFVSELHNKQKVLTTNNISYERDFQASTTELSTCCGTYKKDIPG
jgi:hypothetical protein